MSTGLLGRLRVIVGTTHTLLDRDAKAPYEVDWTGRFKGTAMAVVRPADTQQVADVVRACAHFGTPIIPQGGNTGLVGGGVPRSQDHVPHGVRKGQVVLSTQRLDQIGQVEVGTPSIIVGAGATLGAVKRAVAPHALDVGVDLAARDSATIGGMVATNAGGIHVVAHGSMRQQVLGLTAVLADGTVLDRLPGLVKDNAGYDLPQLLTGSEGTLAIITAVHLRLVASPTSRCVVLVGCVDVADAVGRATAAGRIGGVRACEVMRRDGIALVCAHSDLPPPFPKSAAVLLLLEFDHDPGVDALGDLVGDRDAVLAQDQADIQRLWRYRELHTEAVGAAGKAMAPLKLDVTLPVGGLADFVAALDAAHPGTIVFGHLADGNLHLNLVGGALRAGALEEPILRLVAEHGGTIASEHGIGVAKARFLHLVRDPTDMQTMRSIKRALDPQGILNPGVLLPPE